MQLGVITICLLFAGLQPVAFGLKCFSCTMTAPEGQEDTADMTCVNDPENVAGKNIITCPVRMKWCTIVRNDIKSSGKVSSIERNCAENPVIFNEDIESDELISHYRACSTDLCNRGKGNEDPSSGNGEGDGTFGGMVVPGTSSATHKTSSLCILYIFSFIYSYLSVQCLSVIFSC